MSTERPTHVLITAYVRPAVESLIVNALHSMPGFPGYSATLARGQARGKGAGGRFVSDVMRVRYHMGLRLEIVAESERATEICEAITKAAWTGLKGDGIIFTTPIMSFGWIREARPYGKADVQ